MMTKLALLGAVLGLGMAGPAMATDLNFTGTFSNSNLPASPGGRCPGLTVSIANGPPPLFADGTSNFGAFTSTQSHCLDSGPPIAVGAAAVPYYKGVFSYTFASGNTLTGTYDGLLTNAGAMGVVDNVQHFLITGGTGLFANATGSFLGTGRIQFAGGPPVATLGITNGTITVAAVPEPTSWAMMLAGFGLVGGAMRLKRRSAGISVSPVPA